MRDSALPLVGAALNLVLQEPELLSQAQLAIRCVDFVHSDGQLPLIQVESAELKQSVQGRFNPWAPRIWLNKTAVRPAWTLVHEVGHFLDVCGLGNGQSVCDTDSRCVAWMQAVSQSLPVIRLGDMALSTVWVSGSGANLTKTTIDADIQRRLTYLRSSHEVWARSYAQFVAEVSGDKQLLGQLSMIRDSKYGLFYRPQWTTEEFLPIRDALVEIFVSMNWM